jgi:hypothetical protein
MDNQLLRISETNNIVFPDQFNPGWGVGASFSGHTLPCIYYKSAHSHITYNHYISNHLSLEKVFHFSDIQYKDIVILRLINEHDTHYTLFQYIYNHNILLARVHDNDEPELLSRNILSTSLNCHCRPPSGFLSSMALHYPLYRS